jgi:quercetin dioxygenase-like cupin family protein
MMLTKENVISAINNNQPIFIEKYETNMDKLMNWENVSRQFEINLKKPDSGQNNLFHTTKGYAHFMDKHNFYLDHVQLIESKVRHLVKKIQDVHPKKRITTATTIATLDDPAVDEHYEKIKDIIYKHYISVNDFALKAHHEPNLHNDETDNLYLQCVGEVTWTVHGIEYKIKPGDAIFVPAFTDHIVRFDVVPRMALIVNFLSDKVGSLHFDTKSLKNIQ